MAISNDLFMAILAMDAYNRDYDAGINVSGTQISTALLGQNSSVLTETLADGTVVRRDQPISFFAQTYLLPDGTTVISYRGTDALADVTTGWPIATGHYQIAQAIMAEQFYRQVVSP